MADLVGHTIGQYKITARLGRGGMADVYKAFHPGLSVYRAIKLIRPEFVTSDDFRVRFQKEAQSVASLRHPNIVQIHDFGSEGNSYYMVMEFVEGIDLKQLIQQEGRIRPISRVISLIRQIASALDYAHGRDLIHRDIKPENIMLNKEGLPILMDFGIAKLLTSSTQLTQTGMGIGTPAYMAPEQARAVGDIGPAADIYSLCVVMFELLTGQTPFSADTPMAVMLKAISDPMPMPRSLCDDISEDLESIILKGTAKEPGDRYASAGALEKALQNFQTGAAQEPTLLRPKIEAASPGSRKSVNSEAETEVLEPAAAEDSRGSSGKMKFLLLSLVVLLALGGGGYFYLHNTAGSPSRSEGSGAAPGVAASDSEASAAGEPGAGVPGAGEKERQTANPVAETADSSANVSGNSSVVLTQYRGATQPGVAWEQPVSVQAGDVLFLDILKAKPITDFALSSPDGRKEIFRSYTDVGPVAMPQGGALQLSALTRAEKAGEVDFQLWKLDPAVIEGGEVQPGKYVAGSTQAPGQQVQYRFQGQQDESLFFDLEKSAVTTDFTLTAPDGRREIFRTYGDTGPLQLDTQGTYTLMADPRGDRLGKYEFTLYKLDPAIIDGGTLTLDTPVDVTTDTPGQIVDYKVDLNQGDTLFLDVVKVSNTSDFRLIAPDGRTTLIDTYTDTGPLQIKQSGSHRFQVDPRGEKVLKGEFVLWRLDPPVIEAGALAFDRYAEGSTLQPGQRVSYEVKGSAGQTLYFDLAKASSTTDFTLVAPDGRTEVFKNYSDFGPVALKTTGSYRLVVVPRGDRTVQFEFALFDLNPAVIDGGEISPGQFVQGETVKPGQQIRYHLSGKQGSKILFEATSVSQRTRFVLLAPDGRTEVLSTYNKSNEIELPVDGEYSLLADPQADRVAEFEFVIRPL